MKPESSFLCKRESSGFIQHDFDFVFAMRSDFLLNWIPACAGMTERYERR
jgi:hypothetical protein